MPRIAATKRLLKTPWIMVAAFLIGAIAAGAFLNPPVSGAEAASPNVSLAGVHWYSGDSSMLDSSVPLGERGWNVEVIFDVGWCDGDPATDPGGVRSVAQTAKDHGLVNIIRVDNHQMVAVPTSSGEYEAWASNFIKCTSELSDVAQLYIVGNEPNIEGNISAGQYAAAFNYLYSRRGEMPPGTELLATFNSPFTPPEWMNAMGSALNGVDGFALHTGGIRSNCQDPRQACTYGNWNFDGAFRYYRDVIDQIPSKWWGKPVYVTEFNSYTGDPGSEPENNYLGDWINLAFEELRNYNAARGGKPPVRALAWFVDRPQSWPLWSLRNIAAAREDIAEEFKNPANRPGGQLPTSTPPVASTPTPGATLPPGQNVALGKSWQTSSMFAPDWGGDKAIDGLVSATSKWTSNGATAESWLALDLGQAYNLTGFVVRHAGAAGEATYFNTQAFRLESGASLSGPWTTLATMDNASQTQSVSSLLLNATSRFVRLTITDAGIDNYARIPEFEVYAQSAVGPTPTAPAMPSFCPPSLNFPAVRQELNQRGEDLAFVKIGFHAGVGGNHNGLGEWEQCLDAAGVPFFLKSVDSAGQILEGAQLRAASGVPHTLVYRKAGFASDSYWYDLPNTSLSPYDAAVEHWDRHMQVFPPELLPYKDQIWLETINEIDKGRAEWYGEFAYHTAQLALADGFNWAAFGWSSGEPEPDHWQGPWMIKFLQLAAENPDRIAIALHEYSFDDDSLKYGFYDSPALVGRFQWLYDITDGLGLQRPTVLITEFGWGATGVPSPPVALDAEGDPELDNLRWAAELYAGYPQIKGAAIWYLGAGYGGIANEAQQLIRPLLEYALQTYFTVPLP